MKITTILSAGALLTTGTVGALGVSALTRHAPAAATPEATITPVAYAAASTSATNYEIDGVHSGVVFRITHAGASPFHGMFHNPSGNVTIDPSNPAATSIDVTIETTKVATGNNDRDNHLRGVDFFNAKQFPTCTFKATGGKAAGDGTMTVDGELTLLGKSLPVSATIAHTGHGEFRGSQRSGFEATMSFKRSDFGMTKYIAEGVLGDEVQLTIFIEGVEQ